MSLVNFSNHSSKYWNDKQKTATKQWGGIIDVPFPIVPADASEGEILQLAEESVQAIMKYNPKAVLCQGEFTLTYAIVQLLKKNNIEVVCACSDRVTTEEYSDDGTIIKHAQFDFVRFRRYE